MLALFALAWGAAAGADDFKLKITIRPEVDAEKSPQKVAIELPAAYLDRWIELTDVRKPILAQITRPSALAEPKKPAEGLVAAELHFLAPKLEAGKEVTYTLQFPRVQPDPSPYVFQWIDTSQPKKDGGVYAEQSKELRFFERPVLRYMYSKLDESSKDARSATFKPYHHLYDPAGKRFVTKGPGGLFPHHRGLFFGFNKVSYGPGGKQQADVWHCDKGEYQEHVKFVSEEAGYLLGRHCVEIRWHGRDGAVFATELRELTAYNVEGGTLVQFANKVTTDSADPVRLDGDPQHAGFHFRGAQDIPDKTKQLTYYLRPDGRGEPGQFRNWPERKDHVNLAWNALSFVLDDQRYTCCYLDRPENPKESRFSERDYGRFGSYFEYDLRSDHPLAVAYRVWLQPGEMTVDSVAKLDADFVHPAKITVARE
jgi:hypothetical protein